MIKAGKYKAKVVDYCFRTTAAGKPEPQIRFAWDDEFLTRQEWNWRGSLNEGKAREITLKTLFICGFDGDDLSVLADGVDSGALDTDKELSITVALETGKDGKEYPVIKWVNELGKGAEFANSMDKNSVQAALKEMNLKGDLLALKPKKPAVEIPF